MSEQGIAFTPLNWAVTHDYRNPTLRKIFNRNHANTAIEAARKKVVSWLPFYANRIEKINRANLEFIKTVLEITGADVFADASKCAHRLEYLTEIPGLGIKLIWLVRDPRAFANSLKRRNMSVTESAAWWEKSQTIRRRAFDAFTGEKRILRYEDLCKDPKYNLHSIFEFIGVPPDAVYDNFKAGPHHILGNRMRLNKETRIVFDQAWKSNLTVEEQDKTLKIVGKMAEFLGYE